MTNFDEVIKRMAAEDLAFDAIVAVGQVAPAEIKAHQAKRAEQIADLDKVRGTEDVTYALP